MPLRSGHLKKGTEGSSNEISFDVLQKKKLTTDDVRAGKPWDISSASRKQDVKLSHAEKWVRILGIITAGLVIVALVLLGAVAWMQQQSGSLGNMQSQMSSIKKTSENLESLIVITQNLYNSGTSDIQRVISSEKLEETAQLADKVKQELEVQKQELGDTLSNIGTPIDKDAGNNALTLINKQLILIDRFKAANKYSLPYVKLKEGVTDSLNKLVNADSADRLASSQLMQGNTDDANKSIETANNAKSLALEAKAGLEEAQRTNEKAETPLLDASIFEQYVTYCQLIADAQDSAVASAQAYVDRNKEELATQNEAYNATKEKATEISGKWDKQLTEMLDDAFAEFRQGSVEAFNQDLKERDSLYYSVSNYLKGKE